MSFLHLLNLAFRIELTEIWNMCIRTSIIADILILALAEMLLIIDQLVFDFKKLAIHSTKMHGIGQAQMVWIWLLELSTMCFDSF